MPVNSSPLNTIEYVWSVFKRKFRQKLVNKLNYSENYYEQMILETLGDLNNESLLSISRNSTMRHMLRIMEK